jgi:hypothetical protein
MQKHTVSSRFPILGYHDLKLRYEVVGTAFFINAEGCFVTAAHTLKSTHLQYYALIETCGYPLAPLFFEYFDIDEQKSPLHRDLCIGKISGDIASDFIAFKPSSSLEAEDRLLLEGFASKEYVDAIPGITHADQLFEIEDDEQEDLALSDVFVLSDKPAERDPCRLVLTDAELLKYSKITASFVRPAFEQLYEKTNVQGTFTNGFSIELTSPKLEPAGLSGCPIIHNGLAVGMFIAAKGAINSEYIEAKLREYKLID